MPYYARSSIKNHIKVELERPHLTCVGRYFWDVSWICLKSFQGCGVKLTLCDHIQYHIYLINLHTILHNDKAKTVFLNLCKRITNLKTEIPYLHNYSSPLLWDSKLSSGASCFHWSSLRWFYNLIRIHGWKTSFNDSNLSVCKLPTSTVHTV